MNKERYAYTILHYIYYMNVHFVVVLYDDNYTTADD